MRRTPRNLHILQRIYLLIYLSHVYTMRVFGWLAGGISALHNVPQIIHVCKRKSAADISLTALSMRMLSLVFYILHGILIQDLPILVMSTIIFAQCCIICIQKYRFRTETHALDETTPASPQAPQKTHPPPQFSPLELRS